MAVLCLLLSGTGPVAGAALTVVPHGGVVAGQTLDQWVVAWQRWALGQTAGADAFTDQTGARAGTNQSGPVYFLGGPPQAPSGLYSGSRSFQVPTGKYLFFPVCSIVTLGAVDPGYASNAQECDLLVTNTLNPDVLTLDGDQQGSSLIATHRERSPVDFTATAVANNPNGFPAGTYTDVNTGGYFVMIEPPSPGTHTLYFHAYSNYWVQPDGQPYFGFGIAQLADTITVVPEPTGVAAGVLAGAALLLRRRRPLGGRVVFARP
jgi:hypothetical protein